MRRQNFEILQKLPGRNEAELNARSNYFLANKVKKETQQAIRTFIRANHVKPVPEKNKAIVLCEFQEPIDRAHRGRDVDNIESAVKYILDALTGENILFDDSRKYLIAAPCFTDYGGVGAKCSVTIIDSENPEELYDLLRRGRSVLHGEER